MKHLVDRNQATTSSFRPIAPFSTASIADVMKVLLKKSADGIKHAILTPKLVK
jgi:hypothetical protein